MPSRGLHRSCTIIKRGELYRAHKAMVVQLKHDSFVGPAETHCMSVYMYPVTIPALQHMPCKF